MKKIIASMFACLFMLSCADDSWKQELEDIKAELANQKQLIEALQQNSTITGIEQGNGQYTIKFSDGQAITLTNGQTPIIGIGDNGNWFIDGIDTGKPSQGEDGTDGVDGSNGTNGENGTDGTNGTDGKTPTIEIGANGNWIINGTDTGINAQGQNGNTPTVEIGANGNWFINGVDTGKPSKGEDGTNGTDGKTPTVEIGDNGNWIINGTDTGVKAEGIDGNDAPYITSITIIYDTFFFHFSDGNIISVPLISSNSTLNTKNLFNPQKAVIINGFNFIRSEFIPISKGEALTASTNTTLWQTNCALYDANFNILADSKIYIKDNSKTVTLKWIEGAAYAKFEFRNISDLNQIEKGEKATNYERYTNNRDLLKILSLPSSIPLLTNYNYSIFTDNIISKTAQTESGFYIKDYPIYKDRFIISNPNEETITKEYKIYNNSLIDNAGELSFDFINPQKYKDANINILFIGDSFTDGGVYIESIKNKMSQYNINLNLIGTHNTNNNKKSEALSGGRLHQFICTPSGHGAIITITDNINDNDIPSNNYGAASYLDENGFEWNVVGYRRLSNGSLKLRLGNWNNQGVYGQVIPQSGKLTKVQSSKPGLNEINYIEGELSTLNPFWDIKNNQLDFKQYIEYWDFNIPDIIVLQFTWNDLPVYATDNDCLKLAESTKQVLECIHNQYPKCKIIYSIEPAGAILSKKGSYFYDGSHYSRLKLYKTFTKELKNYPYFYIAPSYAFVDRINGFNTVTEIPNPEYPNDELIYAWDGIHCNTQGMQQIADCLIPYILKAISK